MKKKKCLYCDYVGFENICTKCKFVMESQCQKCEYCISDCVCKIKPKKKV